MNLWRYTAVDPGTRSSTIGELSAASPAEVRASLRRIGLQVVEIKPIRPPLRTSTTVQPMIVRWNTHLRSRRRPARAELYDSLATMLNSGIPVLQALETMAYSADRPGAARTLLAQIRASITDGQSLAQAMRDHSAWFDGTEVAMINAAQHGGHLPQVLTVLADRHERADDLSQKLIGALVYPLIVGLVGIGVALFLSVRTLPELTSILNQSGLETPRLTAVVMSIGQAVAEHWPLMMSSIVLTFSTCMFGPMLINRTPAWFRRLQPQLLRRKAVAEVSLQLAELLRTGVPLVEALRVLAPAVSNSGLRHVLRSAANRVERGDDLQQSFDDPHWFDREYRQLLGIGEATGELDSMLERIGARYQRLARRRIDRLATLMEPAVILALAVLIGFVVMAAVLPLIRLQEIM